MVNKEDIDYVCMKDGSIYAGPDTGDTIPVPDRPADWPIRHKGHAISHGICPEHAAEEDPRTRMNIWGGAL